MSCTDRGVAKLLDIAELVYNLDHTHSMETVKASITTTPRSALLVLSKFVNQFNRRYEQAHLSRQSLTILPSQCVSDTLYTHINISHNELKSLPEELFQLQNLQYLDASHNVVEKLPSVLRWNCPKLKELNVSSNQLTDERKGIIRGATERRHSHVETDDPHSIPQQRVLQLTTHNLYSCVFSLTHVHIGHNPKLTRVPEWVCVLPHLVRLSLEGTPKIQELPKALANFKDLSLISLDPQNFLSPPAKICRQGSAAIITYLRSQLRGSSNYRHMNLMILGWGEEKDKIAKGLTAQKRQSQISPAGSIERGAYEFRGETLDRSVIKVAYHTMNFSAEAMDFSLYQCFLIPRCVYLCVWKLADGMEGLKRHVPVLRNIQSTLPGSRVVFIIIHNEEKPELMLSQILAWESLVLGVQEPSGLYDEAYSSSYGYPRIGQRILINLSTNSDIDRLKSVIHQQAGELKISNSSDKLIEELVPRSYTGLQSHVESKVKLQVTLVRYGEFVDSFRSVSHQSGDLSDDEKEFSLACQFLHDSGTIYHYHEMGGDLSGDLFILNLQWLCNTLAKVLHKAKWGSVSIYEKPDFQSLLCSIGLVSNYHSAIIGIMIKYNLLVPLDIGRTRFLFPSSLPSAPPTHTPYDLTSEDLILRKILFRYLPCSFFAHFTSRVLMYVERLGAQLVVLHNPGLTDSIEVKRSRSSSLRNANRYKLTRGGYIVCKGSEAGEDVSETFKRVRGLSASTLHHETHWEAIHSKLVELSKTIPGLERFVSDSSNAWTATHTLSRAILWSGGIHLEFVDGTMSWVEFYHESVIIASKGLDSARVKALAFLLTCLQDICDEWYINLNRVQYSPCQHCLRNKDEMPFYFNLSQVSTATDQSLICDKCKSKCVLSELAPDLILADFPGELRLKKENLTFEKSENNLVGKEVS